MTTLDLDALEALEKAATPVPWTKRNSARYKSVFIMRGDKYLAESSWHHDSPIYPTKQGTHDNFDFIAALRNAAPALIAAAKRVAAWPDKEAFDFEYERLGTELTAARARIAELETEHERELREAFEAGHAQGGDEGSAYEWGSRPSQSKDEAWKSYLRDREIDRETRAARLLTEDKPK